MKKHVWVVVLSFALAPAVWAQSDSLVDAIPASAIADVVSADDLVADSLSEDSGLNEAESYFREKRRDPSKLRERFRNATPEDKRTFLAEHPDLAAHIQNKYFNNKERIREYFENNPHARTRVLSYLRENNPDRYRAFMANHPNLKDRWKDAADDGSGRDKFKDVRDQREDVRDRKEGRFDRREDSREIRNTPRAMPLSGNSGGR